MVYSVNKENPQKLKYLHRESDVDLDPPKYRLRREEREKKIDKDRGENLWIKEVVAREQLEGHTSQSKNILNEHFLGQDTTHTAHPHTHTRKGLPQVYHRDSHI